MHGFTVWRDQLPNLAGWLVGWLLACLAGWLAAWLPGCLAAWLAGSLAGWLAGWLAGSYLVALNLYRACTT